MRYSPHACAADFEFPRSVLWRRVQYVWLPGVRVRSQLIQPEALSVHCFALTLNLSVQDAVRSIPLVRHVMKCLQDLTTIARGSAKLAQTFKAVDIGLEIGNPISLRLLCTTRWTVRSVAIDAALQLYPVIMPILSEVATLTTVDDSASKARGLPSQFEDGQTMLTLLIAAYRVLKGSDGLSCSLQSPTARPTVCDSMESVQHALYTTAEHEIQRVLLESMTWSPAEDCGIRIERNEAVSARAFTEAVRSAVRNCSGAYILFSRGTL